MLFVAAGALVEAGGLLLVDCWSQPTNAKPVTTNANMRVIVFILAS
jgi:hypothetical protein